VSQASDGARALELPGVLAALVPAARERSYVNAVLYDRAADLTAAYPEIARAYEEIGAAWTVWVPPEDGEAIALLERGGHVLDAAPEMMGRELEGFERPPTRALGDWTHEGTIAEVAAVNDRAYGFGTDSMARGFTRLPAGAAHVYVARGQGKPVACLLTVDLDGNTDVEFVAVVPEARGQGLSGALLAHALVDARERGAETTTLVATKLGRPVYDKLGYRPLGELQMWERR
jgi:GNAT superfamily N-acetyltransferase